MQKNLNKHSTTVVKRHCVNIKSFFSKKYFQNATVLNKLCKIESTMHRANEICKQYCSVSALIFGSKFYEYIEKNMAQSHRVVTLYVN